MKICNQCNYHFNSQTWTCPRCNYIPLLSPQSYPTFAPELAIESEGFEARFFPKIAQQESQNFWFCSRNHLLIYTVKNHFPQAQTFLEIGCGTGFVLQELEKSFPYLRLSGSEIFSAGLEFAQRRLSRTTLLQMDARKIPFFEEFDLIGAFDVIEHIEQDEKVLEQMYKATKRDGGILITVPQHPWLWSQIDDYSHHCRRYRAKELQIKVEDAGFKIVRMTSFVALLLPLMLLSRMRRQKNQNTIQNELQPNRWLNQILLAIMTLERYLICMGVNFPVGGSLLIVAKKIV